MDPFVTWATQYYAYNMKGDAGHCARSWSGRGNSNLQNLGLVGGLVEQ